MTWLRAGEGGEKRNGGVRRRIVAYLCQSIKAKGKVTRGWLVEADSPWPR
jgi:hypothetical protein